VGAENPAVSCLALLESLRHVSAAPGQPALGEEEGVRRFHELTRGILRQGQSRGELRRDVNLEHAASLIESGFFRTLARWLMAGGSHHALYQEIAAKLDIVLNGLTAQGPGGMGRAAARVAHPRGR
jgi:hypothetical protein